MMYGSLATADFLCAALGRETIGAKALSLVWSFFVACHFKGYTMDLCLKVTHSLPKALSCVAVGGFLGNALTMVMVASN